MAVATFAWRETAAHLAELAARVPLAVADDRRRFTGNGPDGPVAFAPPLVLPIGADVTCVADYLGTLPHELGTRVLVLVRAGASALGLWQDEELVAHKVFRRYVVRGVGRAQPAHRKTKGKSREGSRLRLRNARRQLEETNERLVAWWDEFGPFAAVDVGAPRRLWADLVRAEPPLPFPADLARPLPLHFHDPRLDELLGIRRRMLRGRIEVPG